MKRISVFLLIICSLFSIVDAQPVIQNTFIPQGDSSLTMYPLDSAKFSIGSTGAQQTWNYDTLTYLPGDSVLRWYVPSMAPGGNFFPNAQHAYDAHEQIGIFTGAPLTIWRYLFAVNSASAFENIGMYVPYQDLSSVASGLVVPAQAFYYNVPDTVWKFPLQYGDNVSFTWKHDTLAVGYGAVDTIFYRRFRRSYQVDGYGTLTLPTSKTFYNVLKVSYEIETYDTLRDLTNGMVYLTDSLTRTMHFWFVQDTGIVLWTQADSGITKTFLGDFSAGSFFVWQIGNWDVTTSLNTLARPQQTLFVFNRTLYLPQASEDYHLRIVHLNGKTEKIIAPKTTRISLESLPSGVYVAQLYTTKNSQQPLSQIKFVLP